MSETLSQHSFTGTRGPSDAKILVVVEAWSDADERSGATLSGTSYHEMEKLLKESGLDIDDCLFTAAIHKHPRSGTPAEYFYDREALKKMPRYPAFRGLYPGQEMLDGLQKLEALIKHVNPKVIIAMGSYAVWAVCDQGFTVGSTQVKIHGEKLSYKIPKGMQDWRGSHLVDAHGIPVVPVFSLNDIRKNSPWKFLLVHDLRVRVALALDSKWAAPNWNFTIQPNFETTMEFLNRLLLRAALSATPMLLVADIETLGSYIECVGLAWSPLEAVCIPFMSRQNSQGYWPLAEEIAVVTKLKELLEHPNVEVCGQNFIYDYQHLWWHYNIRANYKQETMLAHHVCFPGTNMGLGYLSSLYCAYHYYWKDDGKEASEKEDDVQRWLYNARDCVVTFEVMQNLWTVLARYKLQPQYAIQMIRTHSALQMMMRGVRLDQKRQGEEQLKLLEVASEYEELLEAMMPKALRPPQLKKGESPWYRSSAKLCKFFYETLQMPAVKNHKTFQPTVDDDALSKIAAVEPVLRPLCKTLQEYRHLEAYAQFVNMSVGPDKRMRASFSPTTETFRYRSSADVYGYGRNLQNLPKGNEDE